MKQSHFFTRWQILTLCVLFGAGCTRGYSQSSTRSQPEATGTPLTTETLPNIPRTSNSPIRPGQAGKAGQMPEGEAGGPQPAPSRKVIPGQAPAETFGSASGRT